MHATAFAQHTTRHNRAGVLSNTQERAKGPCTQPNAVQTKLQRGKAKAAQHSRRPFAALDLLPVRQLPIRWVVPVWARNGQHKRANDKLKHLLHTQREDPQSNQSQCNGSLQLAAWKNGSELRNTSVEPPRKQQITQPRHKQSRNDDGGLGKQAKGENLTGWRRISAPAAAARTPRSSAAHQRSTKQGFMLTVKNPQQPSSRRKQWRWRLKWTPWEATLQQPVTGKRPHAGSKAQH